MDLKTSVELNNRVKIPILGLGVWQIPGKECEEAVVSALSCGYRHIDTAAIYGNEQSVGKSIENSGINREEIFVTTKLWNDDHADPKRALEISWKKLQIMPLCHRGQGSA